MVVLRIFRLELKGYASPKAVSELVANAEELKRPDVLELRTVRVRKYLTNTVVEVTCDMEEPNLSA